jgi:formamidopyrimidine-DNA glycosylase
VIESAIVKSLPPPQFAFVPELPEVEVLVRHLAPLIRNKTVRNVEVRRARVIAPTSIRKLKTSLRGAEFAGVTRCGKFLLFTLRAPNKAEPLKLLGHLGMTGRMYLLAAQNAPPKHAAVVLKLGDENFVFEDTRYFGRFTLDLSALEKLGPEPLGEEFSTESFAAGLSKSRQPIKVKLLDQSLVAGIGNIYASEALFRARISPKLSARRLKFEQIERLRQSIRVVLNEAIECGSTVRLDYEGTNGRDRLFYFGSAESSVSYEVRLRVYDRENQPCQVCGTPIRRVVQAARSTFYCPVCQKNRRPAGDLAKSV